MEVTYFNQHGMYNEEVEAYFKFDLYTICVDSTATLIELAKPSESDGNRGNYKIELESYYEVMKDGQTLLIDPTEEEIELMETEIKNRYEE